MVTRRRRTHAELYLDKLAEISAGEQKLISNKALREALGWDEQRYKQIQMELVRGNKLIVGRGYGGSVGLAHAPGSKALKVFVSYSHVDESFKTDLLKHLEPLRKLEIVDTWHDRKIKAGDDWDKQISQNLESADLILLIVSIDFINSSYCYDVELERALERHARKEAVIIPVIVRSCMWHSTPFASIQAIPKDGRPVSLWPDRDEAMLALAESIKQTAEALLDSK